jgi:exosome complex component RRP45
VRVPLVQASRLTRRRQNVDEMVLSRILEKTIRRSSALDTESLCIVAGAKCFALRADVHVLEHDGNVVDASCVALTAALRHFRRPDVTVEGERVTVHDPSEREPVPLSILRHPLCVTFAYVDGGRAFVLDPTLAEEQVREGEVVVSVTAQAELCQVTKYGGATIDAACFVGWTEIAVRTVQRLEKTIQKRLDEDRDVRNKGGIMEELRAENER